MNFVFFKRNLSFCFSRETYLSIETRQATIFQRVQTLDNQLKNLSQRIADIQRVQSKLNDFHQIIQRKFQQINEYHSTINIDENHERLIFIQVEFSSSFSFVQCFVLDDFGISKRK